MQTLFLKRFKHLTALFTVIACAVFFVVSNILSPVTALALLGLYQLSQFALSRRRACCFVAGLSPEQVQEFENICKEIKDHVQDIPLIKERAKRMDDLQGQVSKARRHSLSSHGAGVRWIGNQPFVSDECANGLASIYVLECQKLGALENLVKDSGNRDAVLSKAKGFAGLQTRAALTGTEIPLPTEFISDIVELVFAFGQARQFATVFPLGAGITKLPRLKAGEDDFGYLGAGTAGNSQNVPERRVTAELVTFTANKAGGLIRIPFEIEVDTFVPIGQFLARYIARQFAKLEDKTLFLADGSGTYASQTGVGPYCVANPAYLLKLADGKTRCSDVTLDDLRRLRGKVSPAVLANMAANRETSAAYYMHPTMEPLLCAFNKYPNFVVFKTENGKSTLDGWPVRWIGVNATNDDTAQPEKFATFFGDLSYWYLGERGAPRIEISKEVFFQTDELAMRALERLDVEALAVDAMSTLQLGAAAA